MLVYFSSSYTPDALSPPLPPPPQPTISAPPPPWNPHCGVHCGRLRRLVEMYGIGDDSATSVFMMPLPEGSHHVHKRDRELLTTAPGGATGADHMPSHVQLHIADMDGNGFDDIITH
eukprot:4340261-Prymnesium_polylepis.1